MKTTRAGHIGIPGINQRFEALEREQNERRRVARASYAGVQKAVIDWASSEFPVGKYLCATMGACILVGWGEIIGHALNHDGGPSVQVRYASGEVGSINPLIWSAEIASERPSEYVGTDRAILKLVEAHRSNPHP
jgi:hypothetical protein